MRRRLLTVIGVVALGTAASAPFWAPVALRELAVFQIQRVEVSGMHLVAPHEILTASGVRLGQSVWDDETVWVRALREHRGVADVTIERSLPSTLRIRVQERQPVALIQVGTLRAATATGELLPVDPSRASLDLPIVRVAIQSVEAEIEAIEDPGTLELLAEAGRLALFDAQLMSRVSEIGRVPAGHLELRLGDPEVRIWLPAGADPARLRQLRSVLDDVEQRLDAGSPSGTDPVHVDLRFADQVVVRFSS